MFGTLTSCLCQRRSISFLRQKARAQKARKTGLLGLSASFPYMNFALLMRRNYLRIQVQTVAFHRGRKSGLTHVVAQRGGGKRRPFFRRKTVKSESHSVSCFSSGFVVPKLHLTISGSIPLPRRIHASIKSLCTSKPQQQYNKASMVTSENNK